MVKLLQTGTVIHVAAIVDSIGTVETGKMVESNESVKAVRKVESVTMIDVSNVGRISI